MPASVTDLKNGFDLGPWTVIPERGLIRQGDRKEHLEPMVMDVLVVLASRQGAVVTRDQLVHDVWNDRFVTDEAIVAKIATLRQKLGDDSKNPKYIETIPRRGYRLIMPVKIPGASGLEPAKPAYRRVSRSKFFTAALVLAVVVAYLGPWSPPPRIDSVAVLQFKILSANPAGSAHWVAGFREELFINLGRVPDLKVAKGPEWPDNKTARQLARELDVDGLIHGTLRNYGAEIKITVEIIAADGFQVWSDELAEQTKDMFQLQENVSALVLEALGRNSGSKLQAATLVPDPGAYEIYSRGLLFLEKRDVESLQEAEKLFQEAIRIDPNFGPAYLRQAVSLLLLSDYAAEQRREIFQEAIDVANQGVQADPSIREAAEMVHGFVHHQFGAWDKAAAAFASSFRGPTVYPTAYNWHSRLLNAVGLLDESLEEAIRATSMDPGSQVLNSRVANAYLWTNNMSRARHYFDEANKKGVGSPIHHFGYTMFLIRDNQLGKARASTKYAYRLLQADDWWVDPVFDGLANPDDKDLRAAAYKTIRRMVAEGVPPYITMITWALFEEPDRVMEIAMQIADSGTLYAYESAQVEIFYLDELKSFREHPDFSELLRKLGLTDYWSSIGCRWQDDQVLCP